MHKLQLDKCQRTLWLCCVLILLQYVATTTAGAYVYGEPKYKCPVKSKIIYPCTCVKGSDVGLYVRCDNTNLATLSVGLQNLAALDIPVEQLTIYKGHFARLYGPMFAKVKARLLTIEHTPIDTIEDYAFYGLNKTLEQLQIIGSNLSTITPLSFGILGKVSQLIIDGHAFTSLAKDLFAAQELSNQLEVLRIINGPLNDLPIETFQPLRKLKTLDLHGNALENLKRNQFKNLRTVAVLDVSHNRIKKLEAQHIADLTNLGWFNVSHNALTELSRGTYARNSVLKVLHMDHNQISRLDVNSFRGMRTLRRLFLHDNKISDIGRGTFSAVARIGTIDLARNALKKIDYQMFAQLNYVELLNMAENNITIVEKNAFKDVYQSVINISHNALERIEPYAFENCVNITILDLSFNRLSNFSKNAFDLTTFADNFQLSYNFFRNLAQIPIQNMTSIRVLNVSHNNVEQIPKNCFPKLYELHTIDVSYNNISFIANGVFQSLFSLRFLNLSHNSMQDIKSSVFGTLPTLLEMDLSYNEINNIVRGALAKLTSMRTLYLQNNRLEKIFQIPISLNDLYLSENNIESIPANTWPVMNSLIYLDLSDNQIGDSLEAHSFNGLLVLQRLFLRRNGITQPPADCLAGMTTLQYLYLEHNNISTLDKSAFGKLPVLFELNLHGNEVKDIGKRAFEGLLQLLNLNLSANAIESIPNDAFIGLPSLRKLDLAHNYLTKLDNKTNGVLDDLLSLEELNLSHNKISFVTKKTFPSHRYIPYNLKYLDLSYNQMPVLTYDITFGTKKLLYLNLSHNHINELRRFVLSNFTALQTLDLSYNELSNLKSEPDIFTLPANLTKIYLQNNKIFHIPYEQFNRSLKFDTIDLRNNTLSGFPVSLVSALRNGTAVFYAGNPMHCSCAARPLKHYMLEQTDIDEDQERIFCQTPSFLAEQRLADVNDENLVCDSVEQRMYTESSYDELTDIRFREIVKAKDNRGNITVRWFVAAVRDIADFTVYVRNMENEILYETDYAYNERVAQIPIAQLRANAGEMANAEICIVSKTSSGKRGRWFSKQCQHLPDLKTKSRGFFDFSFSRDSNNNGKSANAASAIVGKCGSFNLLIMCSLVLLFMRCFY